MSALVGAGAACSAMAAPSGAGTPTASREVERDAASRLQPLRARLADLRFSDLGVWVGHALSGPLRVASVPTLAPAAPAAATSRWTFESPDNESSSVSLMTAGTKPGRQPSPFFGVGFGDIARKGFGFFADIGIVFQPLPRTRLASPCNPASPAVACDAILGNVEPEQQRLQRELADFKRYPAANIGFSYGF